MERISNYTAHRIASRLRDRVYGATVQVRSRDKNGRPYSHEIIIFPMRFSIRYRAHLRSTDPAIIAQALAAVDAATNN